MKYKRGETKMNIDILELVPLLLFSIISSIADMARTASNVIGAAASTVLVANSEHELDERVYNA